MKLLNQSRYDTASLRKLFSYCLKRMRKDEKVPRRFKVKVRYHNRSHVGGSAYLNGGPITMKLPKEPTFQMGKFDFVQKVADTFLHEVGHVIGMQHDANGDTAEKWYQDWIKESISSSLFPLPIIEKKVLVMADVKIKRYHHAIKKLKWAEARLKRTQNLVKKWSRKVKYYKLKI